MTTFGKILVFLTTVLSFLFLAWAISVYTTRLDWFPPPGTPKDEKVGRIDQLKAENDALNLAIARARSRADLGRVALLGQENRRLAVNAQGRPLNVLIPGRWERQEWYRRQLGMVLYGYDIGNNAARVDPAVQQMNLKAFGKEMLLPYDQPTGRQSIVLDPGTGVKPVQAIETTNLALAAALRKIQEAQAMIMRLAKEEQELLDTIIDRPDPKNPGFLLKGLRTQVREQVKIGEDALNELEYIRPFGENRLAEQVLLLQRQMSLEKRLAEVKNWLQSLKVRNER